MGNCLFRHAQGWGIEHQLKKKSQISGNVPGGDGNSKNWTMHYFRPFHDHSLRSFATVGCAVEKAVFGGVQLQKRKTLNKFCGLQIVLRNKEWKVMDQQITKECKISDFADATSTNLWNKKEIGMKMRVEIATLAQSSKGWLLFVEQWKHCLAKTTILFRLNEQTWKQVKLMVS